MDSISVTGTIASADSRDVSAIASNVEVQTVNYKVGDYVNAGEYGGSSGFYRSETEADRGTE